jgi:6-phosphogluconolactonase
VNHPAKSYKVFFAVGVLILLIAMFSGNASAATTPKFVYVANSGSTSSSDTIATFSVTATAVCSTYPCASPISISGSFTVNLTTNTGMSGTMYLTDTSDLKSSPVALPFNQQGNAAPDPNEYLFFRAPGGTPPVSYVELIFPFPIFPKTYSGGSVCTANAAGCSDGVSSLVEIGGDDMSAALVSEENGRGNYDYAYVTSGTVTLTGITDGTQSSVAGSVSGYAVDPTTGALTALAGSPFAAGSRPSAVAADPSNKFLYVANKLSNNVSAFTVDAKSGALTEIAASPFAVGSAPVALAVDPLGKFVYVANQTSNSLSVFALDGVSGALTPASGSPFPTAMSPNSVAVDPLGRFVYVPNFVVPQAYGSLDSNVSAYSVDRTGDTLHTVPGSPFSVNAPVYATVDPSGKFLYVSVDSSSILFGINGYNIDGTTGALEGLVSDNMYPLGKPSATAFDPTGTFFYALDDRPLAGGYDIVAYAVVNANGQFGSLPGAASPFTAGPYPLALAIDPSGKFIYTSNFLGNNVSAYSIDAATGNLTQIPGSPFAAGASPISVAIVSSSSTPFAKFEAAAEIDEDRKTSFRVAGFFTLGDGSDGIDPVTQDVVLQVGSFTATIPAGSFREIGKHTFKFEGTINSADLRITIDSVEVRRHEGRHSHEKRVESSEYLFTAEGSGKILAGVMNPVTIGLTVGDNEGSKSLRADIDK